MLEKQITWFHAAKAKRAESRIISAIRQADSALPAITMALVKRYMELFPNDSIHFLTLPKNNIAEKKRLINLFLEDALREKK